MRPSYYLLLKQTAKTTGLTLPHLPVLGRLDDRIIEIDRGPGDGPMETAWRLPQLERLVNTLTGTSGGERKLQELLNEKVELLELAPVADVEIGLVGPDGEGVPVQGNPTNPKGSSHT